MAKQRYVNTRFWIDDYISNLDPVEKLLFLYFLTNPFTEISGVYEVPLKTISTDTGIEKEMILKILKRFEKDKKIKYQDGWVVLKNFVKHQETKNPKIKRGIELSLKNCPSWVIAYVYPMDRLSHSNTNTNTNRIPEQSSSDDLLTNKKDMKTFNIETGEYQEEIKKGNKRSDVIALAKMFDEMATNYTGKPIITPRSYFIVLNAMNTHKMKPKGIELLFKDWFDSKEKTENKVNLSFALSAGNINSWKTKN
jgi:hypothetical protein